jgi:hypothetical protein
MRLLIRSLIIWFVLIITESLNGTIRVLWLVPTLGEPLGEQVSFGMGLILVFAIAILFVPWLYPVRRVQLLKVGLFWVVLTVLFELYLGRVILGYSWERIFADYNLAEGGLMPLGLGLLALAPMIAAQVRGGLQRSAIAIKH